MTRAFPIALVAVLVACGGSPDLDGPLVGRIPDALDALAAEVGADDPDLFEVVADTTGITLVLAESEIDNDSGEVVGTFATPYRWEDGELTRVGEVSPAAGAVFRASAISIDPGRVFERIRDELDDPEITDLVIQGGPDGSVVIDASIVNDRGGRLLVLLGADGTILGVQAA
jgi:hypothetical protein